MRFLIIQFRFPADLLPGRVLRSRSVMLCFIRRIGFLRLQRFQPDALNENALPHHREAQGVRSLIQPETAVARRRQDDGLPGRSLHLNRRQLISLTVPFKAPVHPSASVIFPDTG